MIFDGKLEKRECIATIGALTLIPISLSLPNLSAEKYGTASFLHSIYITIIAGVFFLLLFWLHSKMAEKDILDIAEDVGGKFLKYITGLILIFYMIAASIVTLSEFNENIRNILLDEAPESYVLTVFFITGVVACFIGLKAIFRVRDAHSSCYFFCRNHYHSCFSRRY